MSHARSSSHIHRRLAHGHAPHSFKHVLKHGAHDVFEVSKLALTVSAMAEELMKAKQINIPNNIKIVISIAWVIGVAGLACAIASHHTKGRANITLRMLLQLADSGGLGLLLAVGVARSWTELARLTEHNPHAKVTVPDAIGEIMLAILFSLGAASLYPAYRRLVDKPDTVQSRKFLAYAAVVDFFIGAAISDTFWTTFIGDNYTATTFGWAMASNFVVGSGLAVARYPFKREAAKKVREVTADYIFPSLELAVLGFLSQQVLSAMSALGDDLEMYLFPSLVVLEAGYLVVANREAIRNKLFGQVEHYQAIDDVEAAVAPQDHEIIPRSSESSETLPEKAGPTPRSHSINPVNEDPVSPRGCCSRAWYKFWNRNREAEPLVPSRVASYCHRSDM